MQSDEIKTLEQQNTKKPGSEHSGHRKRLIARLATGDLTEHEELEALLFNACPRKNTNDVAHRLLVKFGSIPNLFRASMAEIQSVEGVGESVAAYLVCIGRFYARYYHFRTQEFTGTFSSEEFLAFVKEHYKKETTEVIDAYLLGADGKIFHCERFERGTAEHVEIEPTLLTKLLIQYRPAGVALVHNHPKGEARPSKRDEGTTRKCQVICSAQNVILCDHLIYAPDGVYSYYLDGKMQSISKEYAIENVLEREGL